MLPASLINLPRGLRGCVPCLPGLLGVALLALSAGAGAAAPAPAGPATTAATATTTTAAPPALIALTPEQQRQAGIRTQKLEGSNAAVAGAAAALVLQGTAVLPNQATEVLSAPLAGVLQALLVNPMDSVRPGQALARLSSPQLLVWQREFIQAQAQAALALTRRQRDEALFREGLISESRLQETRNAQTLAGVAARERRQALALAGLGDAALRQLEEQGQLWPELTLRARQGGTVAEQLAAPGQHVEMGTALLRIVDGQRLWLDLQATREQGEAIRVGDAVRVRGCAGTGRIVARSAIVSASAQTLGLRASMPDAASCLRPGQFVDAEVRAGAAAAPADARQVPAAALLRQGGRSYVFVHVAGGFVAHEVMVLSQDGERASVRARLPAEAELAVQGIAALKGAWLGMGSARGS